MSTRRRRSFKSKLRESWWSGELSGVRELLGSTKVVAEVFFGAFARPLLILLALALVAFLFGFHRGGPATQVIAFLLFAPLYGIFLHIMYIGWSLELMSKAKAVVATVVIGLFVWVGLDLLGFIVLPSVAFERITGLQPLGPVYRLVEAFTGVWVPAVGYDFWINL